MPCQVGGYFGWKHGSKAGVSSSRISTVDRPAVMHRVQTQKRNGNCLAADVPDEYRCKCPEVEGRAGA
jgi:hypothetical protein